MNSLVLGGLLKRIYTTFDMSKFDDRLKLQKIVYLMQVKGFNLEINYSWYLYGPYSAELTKLGFQMQDFEKTTKVSFAEEEQEKKYQQFLEKIEPYKNNTFWLEMATSIHLLKKTYPKKTKEEIIQNICEKREQLETQRKNIEKEWESIISWLS